MTFSVSICTHLKVNHTPTRVDYPAVVISQVDLTGRINEGLNELGWQKTRLASSKRQLRRSLI